jgi:alkylhydroperoxidase family enzyme
MPRIKPLGESEISDEIRNAFDDHVKKYNTRITNMKSTLGRSLPAFEVYMEWYRLYEVVKKILGERLAYLYSWSISHASNCPLCSVYFRKIIIDKDENPESLQLSAEEQDVLDFGAAIATNQGHVEENIYNKLSSRFDQEEMVMLIAFAGQMIATNIFNNVIETDIDEYLFNYLPKSIPGK